ncbi:MAG: hypothetical protein GF365_02335 [Candidatus Buchananbacteria bacterium]|nr:hypothetical protein [Candidatus Buchananbacteria bacterium]
MITKEVIQLISARLRSVINHLILIGLLFFILAMSILFYPEILQILFILVFFVVSFSAFLIAVKINNIKENFDNILKIIPKTRKGKK